MTACTRIYTAHGKVAHLSLPYPAPLDALCPAMSGWRGIWLGTGSKDEYDTAESMPACRNCERAASQTSPAAPPPDGSPPDAAGDAAGVPPGLLIPCPGDPAADETPAGEEHAGGAAPAGPAPEREYLTADKQRQAPPRRSLLGRLLDWLS